MPTLVSALAERLGSAPNVFKNMGDSNPTTSCLSAEPHEPRDSTLHYLGCAEFGRDRYISKAS